MFYNQKHKAYMYWYQYLRNILLDIHLSIDNCINKLNQSKISKCIQLFLYMFYNQIYNNNLVNCYYYSNVLALQQKQHRIKCTNSYQVLHIISMLNDILHKSLNQNSYNNGLDRYQDICIQSNNILPCMKDNNPHYLHIFCILFHKLNIHYQNFSEIFHLYNSNNQCFLAHYKSSNYHGIYIHH